MKKRNKMVISLLTAMMTVGGVILPQAIPYNTVSSAYAAEVTQFNQNQGYGQGSTGGYGTSAYDLNAAQPTLPGFNATNQSRFTADDKLFFRWRSHFDYSTSSPVIGQDGTLYYSVQKSDTSFGVMAIGPDGNKKWFFSTFYEATVPVIASDGTLYFVASNKIYAVNSNGTKKWEYTWSTTQSRYTNDVPVVIGFDGTVFAQRGGTLFALNASNGSLKWKYTGLSIAQYNLTLVIAKDGNLYVPSTNKLIVLSPSGSLIREIAVNGNFKGTPVIGDDGTIYCTLFEDNANYARHGKIVAINPMGGIKWSDNFYSSSTVSTELGMPSVGPNGDIYVSDVEGNLICYTKNGFKKWSKNVGVGAFSLVFDKSGKMYGVGIDPSSKRGKFLIVLDLEGNILQKEEAYNAYYNQYARYGFIHKLFSAVIGPDGTVYVGQHAFGRFMLPSNQKSFSDHLMNLEADNSTTIDVKINSNYPADIVDADSNSNGLLIWEMSYDGKTYFRPSYTQVSDDVFRLTVPSDKGFRLRTVYQNGVPRLSVYQQLIVRPDLYTGIPLSPDDFKEPYGQAAYPKPLMIIPNSPILKESESNDGTFTQRQTVTVTGGTLVNDLSSGVTVNNLPPGLTTTINRLSETQFEIVFNGKATNHANSNDVNNASITVSQEKIIGSTGSVTSGSFTFDFNDPASKITVTNPIIKEADANDGSITQKQMINVTDGTFTSDVTSGVVVANLPVGLTTTVTRLSDTQLEIVFGGKATNHQGTNDVTNVQVTIDKSKVTNATENLVATFGIDFADAFQVSNLQAAIVNEHVNLSWNSLQGADGYVVERYVNGVKEKNVSVTNSIFEDNSVVAATAYEYRVSPVVGTQIGSPKSVVITTPTDLENEGPSYGNPEVSDSTSIRIPLNIPGAVRYEVFRNNSVVYDGPGPEYIDRNLQTGVTYKYKVVGYDAQGNPIDTVNREIELPLVSVKINVVKEKLAEASLNDGSISDKQLLTITDGKFSSDVVEGVTLFNVPNGLVANVVRKSDTQLEISFSGNAVAHENRNDTNVEVTIDMSKVVNATQNVTTSFGIDFTDAQVTFEVTNLQAAIVNDTVNLSWNVLNGADSYIVERYAEGIKEKSRTVTSRTFVDDTAVAGRIYEYRVTPKRGTEIGTYKAVTITTPIDLEDGGQTDPTYGGEPQVEDATSIRIPLNITGAVRYEVIRNGVEVYDGPGPEFVDKSLQAGVMYRYKVIGYDAQGNPIDTTYDDIQIEDKAIQNLRVTDVQKDRVSLSFDTLEEASGYIVERYINGKFDKRSSTTANSFTDFTVAFNTEYTYKVKAVINGNQTVPASITVKTLEDVVDPIENTVNVFTSEVTFKSVKVSWDAELRYDKAVVKRDGQVVYNGAPAYNGYFTDNNLDAQTTYEYTVDVLDSKGNVTGTKVITVTTLPLPPAEAGDENFFASDVQFNKVTLTWKPIDGATYYMLYRFNGTKQEFAKIVYAPKIAFTDTTVSGGNTYKYKLVPKVGTKFTEPLELEVTTKAAELPTVPTLNYVTLENGVVKVKATNNDASASMYVVITDQNGSLKYRTAVSSGYEKVFKNLAVGVYTVKVEAYNRSYRTSSYSDSQSITLTPEMVMPPLPQNLNVSVTSLDATYTLIKSTVDNINDPEVTLYFYLYTIDGKLVSNAIGKTTADQKIGWEYRGSKTVLLPGEYKVVTKSMKFSKYSSLVEKTFTLN